MAALLHSGESGRSSLIASAEAVDTGVAPRLQEAVRMRGSRVLLVGISALMATPIAIGVATSALGAQLAPRTSLLVSQPAAAAPVAAQTGGSDVSVGIPAIAFQRDIAVKDGQLMAAVLVNAGEPAGTVQVVSASGQVLVAATATPGVALRIDIAVSQQQRAGLHIDVKLANGITASRLVSPATN